MEDNLNRLPLQRPRGKSMFLISSWVPFFFAVSPSKPPAEAQRPGKLDAIKLSAGELGTAPLVTDQFVQTGLGLDGIL